MKRIFNLATKALFFFLVLNLALIFCLFNFQALAASPTPNPTETQELSPTPVSEDEEEKVKEIRDKVKAKVDEIREKMEKKAYVGNISQITDSTLALENFRGTQRVRINEETTIIGSDRKVIETKDLAVENRVIAMGTVSENEILEAVRIVVVAQPTNPPVKKIVFLGIITEVDTKKSEITLSSVKNQEESLALKVDAKTEITKKPENEDLRFKNLEKDQKVIVIYPQAAEGKIPVARSISILP